MIPKSEARLWIIAYTEILSDAGSRKTLVKAEDVTGYSIYSFLVDLETTMYIAASQSWSYA